MKYGTAWNKSGGGTCFFFGFFVFFHGLITAKTPVKKTSQVQACTIQTIHTDNTALPTYQMCSRVDKPYRIIQR